MSAAIPLLGPLFGVKAAGPDGGLLVPDDLPVPLAILEAFDLGVEIYEEFLDEARRAPSPGGTDEPGAFACRVLALPPAYAAAYDESFLRRLSWTFGEVTRKIAYESVGAWACVAEELVVHGLIDCTKTALDEARNPAELRSLHVSVPSLEFIQTHDPAALEATADSLAEYLFEDTDYLHLYWDTPESARVVAGELEATSGVAPLDLLRWFEPFNAEREVHPLSRGLIL
jgi:hypothetical protein